MNNIEERLNDWCPELDEIADQLGTHELLAGLAEEASELAQAALKLRRVMTQTNPTPKPYEEALRDLHEELADVLLCAAALGRRLSEKDVAKFINQKAARWYGRVVKGERHEEN